MVQVAFPFFDSILDALYFILLENENLLVHVPEYIISHMGSLLFIAALKDILVCRFITQLYKNGPKPDPLSERSFKTVEILTCFILEDFYQVTFQYLYFEKYRFKQPAIAYVNAGN